MNHWTAGEEELGMEETSAVFPSGEKGVGAVLWMQVSCSLVRRRCKTTKCFGERIYLCYSNILVVFHRMKLDFLG